jgi:hypothetical protein
VSSPPSSATRSLIPNNPSDPLRLMRAFLAADIMSVKHFSGLRIGLPTRICDVIARISPDSVSPMKWKRLFAYITGSVDQETPPSKLMKLYFLDTDYIF